MLKPVKCQQDLFTNVHPTWSYTGIYLEQNFPLTSPESMFDSGGEHPSEESSAGGRGGAAAGQQCRAGLRGGHPAAGG